MLELNKIKYQHTNNFFLMAGPCAIVSEEMIFRVAGKPMKLKFDFFRTFINQSYSC